MPPVRDMWRDCWRGRGESGGSVLLAALGRWNLVCANCATPPTNLIPILPRSASPRTADATSAVLVSGRYNL